MFVNVVSKEGDLMNGKMVKDIVRFKCFNL